MNAGIHVGKVVMFLLAGVLLSSIMGSTFFYWTSATVPQFPVGSGSWNARVPCSSPWIVRITDITANMSGSASQTSSIFNPGSPNKRWLTPGSTPPGWVSPGPPCTITNSHGTVAVFVEIDGVKRESIANEDCSSTYDTVNGATSMGASYCDSTFDLYDPAIVPNDSTSCTSSTDPTCYGKIHSEIDHDWKAEHYCGSSTTCDDVALGSQTTTSTLIDVQGFVNCVASTPGKLVSDYQLHFQPILPHYWPDHHVHGLSFRRRFPLHIQLGLRRRRLGNWKPNDPCLFNKRSLYGYPDHKR